MMKHLKIPIFLFILLFSLPGWSQYTLYGEYDALPSDGGEAMTTVEIEEHANLARCLCDEAVEVGDTYSYYLAFQYGGPFDGADNYFYVGSDCSNTAVVLDECADFGGVNVNSLQNSTEYIPMPVNWLVDPSDGVCSMINSGSNTFYIFSEKESRTVVYSQTISFDTNPPTAPYDVSASPGETAITVSWSSADIDEEDIEYFNVLCMKNGDPAESSEESKASWVDTEDICGKVITVDGTVVTNNTNNANNTNNVNNTTTTNNTNNTNNTTTTSKSSSYKSVNNYKALTCPSNGVVAGVKPYKCYVCGTASRSTNKLRITGLENGTEYSIAVVAIDSHKNVSDISTVLVETPVPTTDFAEKYKEDGGTASGDFCFIATSVFGGKDHFAVQILRKFRDQILMQNSYGRSFVKWYYANGAAWASFLDGQRALSLLVKIALLPLVFIAIIMVVTPWWGYLFFMGFIFVLIKRKNLLKGLRFGNRIKYVS
jgi:hypothetical protein